MRYSKFLSVLVISAVLIYSNVLANTTDSDQISDSMSSRATRSLEAAQSGNSKIFLRTLKALSVDSKSRDEAQEEERSAIVGTFKNLFKGPAARKAAKAAKAAKVAEQNKLLSNWYGKLLERDDFLYDAMAVWRRQGKSGDTISTEMMAVGRSADEASIISRRFDQYSLEMKNAGK
ncbi:Putative RxLR effector [Phytophthora palmivora]|uniref:RxLR effector protein n=1 Tax=Phytophthora palmivora TaxID=4796 RepID=A0A2P4XS52_9STRA|nr:Putative RxLR effector [Phytophthora palmivora]